MHLSVLICVLLMTISLTKAAPQLQRNEQLNSRGATIVQHENNNIGIGNYHFAYQTSDGTAREERAELKNVGTEKEALVVEGSYSYVGADGVTYTVNYIADENGFRPVGVHIPGTNNL